MSQNINTHADKSATAKNNAVAHDQTGQQETWQSGDDLTAATSPNPIQLAANNSLQVKQLRTLQRMADNSPYVKQLKKAQALADHQLFKPKPQPGVKAGTTVQKKNAPPLGNFHSPAIVQKKNLVRNKQQESWHISQNVTSETNRGTGKPIQRKEDALAQDSYFSPGTGSGVNTVKQAAMPETQAHLTIPSAKYPALRSPAVVQRSTLEVTTVDFDPKLNLKYDFNVNNANTTQVLNDSYKTAKATLNKLYKPHVQAAFNDFTADAVNVAAKDIPTLADDVGTDVLGRYDMKKKLGPLPAGEKAIVKNAIKTELNDFMKDRIFGRGLNTKAAKADFNNMINISAIKSRGKGVANEMTQAALNGFDGGADAAYIAVKNAFTALKGQLNVNVSKFKSAKQKANYDVKRQAQYVIDVGTLPAGGRGPHHNEAGWLPALPRPALEPWKKAAGADHSRTAVVLWNLTVGSPSLYLEFNGGPTASRIVYDAENDIGYATMHYASVGGYNPFFKIQ